MNNEKENIQEATPNVAKMKCKSFKHTKWFKII